MSKKPNPELIDGDNPEWTAEDFRKARPAKEVLSPDLYAALIAMNRGAGVRGPGKKPVKVQTTIRFDPDVLAALKATGTGWQTRVNDVMRRWVVRRRAA
ncbi:MAG: BrnA antitoxin family protein [Pseudomonadales bacterium]|jgi:uncharacterized protein (DUF4415 family)|nr:BrnA antitoxin family protein [Pseudomonadales bacterium]